MSIPLDQLYHYIDNITNEMSDNVIIYRFYPHGSKKLEDLSILKSIPWEISGSKISMYCNDQEPLNYELYQNIIPDNKFANLLKSLSLYQNRHLNTNPTIYSKVFLLHSEKRSSNLTKYQNDSFIPIYYWSHAIIALDWFRYAQHVTQQKQVKKLFLIYNRAWAGTREYRLKFAESLIRLGLENVCKTNINPIEPELGIHYDQHHFDNSVWRPTHVLENYFPPSTAHSQYSADFNIEDYESTDIEIVLETLFDDDRLHLTEKSLRPIACGQPFILAGTHGSLEYLRSYGFKTFGDIWGESYDQIEDSQERLYAIADLMRNIANWDTTTRKNKMAQARAIVEYNRQHFFSKEFFNSVNNELKNNIKLAIDQLYKTNSFNPFINHWEHLLSFKEIRDYVENKDNPITINQIKTLLNLAKQLTD